MEKTTDSKRIMLLLGILVVVAIASFLFISNRKSSGTANSDSSLATVALPALSKTNLPVVSTGSGNTVSTNVSTSTPKDAIKAICYKNFYSCIDSAQRTFETCAKANPPGSEGYIQCQNTLENTLSTCRNGLIRCMSITEE